MYLYILEGLLCECAHFIQSRCLHINTLLLISHDLDKEDKRRKDLKIEVVFFFFSISTDQKFYKFWAFLFHTGCHQHHNSQAVAPCFGLTKLVLQQDKPAGNLPYMQQCVPFFVCFVYI